MSVIHVNDLSTTTTPNRTIPSLSRSIQTWLALMVYLVAVKITLAALIPNAFNDPAQEALFSWPALGIWTVLGVVGIWFAHRTGFPAAWDQRVSNRNRFTIPALIGLAFGVGQVFIDLLTQYTPVIAAQHGLTQQFTDYASMALIFPAGAVSVEVGYRLFIIPVLLWLISNVLLGGRAQAPVFWLLAVLTSAIEPLSALDGYLALPGGLALFLVVYAFGLNFVQATFFRRYGFLAAILVRVVFYIVWHVLYIH